MCSKNDEYYWWQWDCNYFESPKSNVTYRTFYSLSEIKNSDIFKAKSSVWNSSKTAIWGIIAVLDEFQTELLNMNICFDVHLTIRFWTREGVREINHPELIETDIFASWLFDIASKCSLLIMIYSVTYSRDFYGFYFELCHTKAVIVNLETRITGKYDY